MRIRTIAILLTAVFGGAALSGAALLYEQQRSRLTRIDEAKALVRFVGQASRFVEAMALERGTYNQFLVSASQGSREPDMLVRPRVAMTDAVFSDTDAVLSSLPVALVQPIAQF